MQESCCYPSMWRDDHGGVGTPRQYTAKGPVSWASRSKTVKEAASSSKDRSWEQADQRRCLYKGSGTLVSQEHNFILTCFSLYPRGESECHVPLRGTLHLLPRFRAPADFHHLFGFCWLPRSWTGSLWRIQTILSLPARLPTVTFPTRALFISHGPCTCVSKSSVLFTFCPPGGSAALALM